MTTTVGTLEIEMAANIARLTEDFAAAKAEVNKSVGDIQRSISRMQTDIESSMNKIGSAVNLMTKAFAAVAVVTAGGALFGKSIEESNKLTMEANKLGKQLGITATEAGILNVALGDVYVESDTLLGANQKLVKTLGTNEAAFKNLGVATRDSNGNFRSSVDIMLDVNTKLLTFKEGVDRNIEGQKIYGKQWGEVQGILKLTTAGMEDARKKSEELGLVVGKENVEATANYRAAMNDVGDVISALKKSVGDALLPILTDLGNWFASVGPEAAMVMKGAVGALASEFYGLRMAVEIAWELIKLFVRTSVNVLLSFADAATHALQFDFTGARAAWKTGSDAIASDFGAAMDSILAKAEANRDKINALFAKPTATDKKEGGAHSEGSAEKDAGKSQMSDWKAELDAKKEAEGQFFKSSLADDETFWQAKLAHVRKGSADEKAIRHELFGIHKQMAQQKFADEQEAFKADMAAARAGSAERIAIATEAARRVGETYGLESKEYLAAIKEIRKAAEEFDKEQEKLEITRMERVRDHNLAMIGMERDRLAQQKNLGQISDSEEIAQLKALKEREYQIELQALQDKGRNLKQGSVEYEQNLNEQAKLKDKHTAAMVQMDNQQTLAIKKNWESMLGAVNSAFEKSIAGMIMGTQTLHQAMANIGQAILAEFVNMGVKRVTAWMANEAAMLFSSKAKDSAVMASGATAATVGTANKAIEATAVVGSNAAEAASGAAASQAPIPIAGPALALAAFAGTMALVLGARSLIHSSAGGEWQVPSDRLNLVHKNETILPAHIAGPLRNMVEGGGSMGGGHTISITAMDSRDVQRALMQGGALHKAITELNRNFSL